MYMNDHDQTLAPYGDRRPASSDEGRAAPWDGAASALLVVALVLFLGAAVALVIAIVRIWLTIAEDAVADIAVGSTLMVFLALILSGCALTSAALRKRRG